MEESVEESESHCITECASTVYVCIILLQAVSGVSVLYVVYKAINVSM